MSAKGLRAVLLTSMHNVAYYSGFLYYSSGRTYACIVTETGCTTISANIDLGQPWRRSYGDNLIYTDWKRDNYAHAVNHDPRPISSVSKVIISPCRPGRR